MILLVVGLVLFFAVHSISIVAPAWRDLAVARIGTLAWRGVYSVASLVGLVLVAKGYGEARLDPTVLYVVPAWLRHVSMLLLLPVFPLVLATYFPGRIRARLKHPMLIAVKIWAFAHLLANGTLADVLLFGGFLAWAVAELVSAKRRAARAVPGAPPTRWNDAIAVAGGLAIYAVFATRLHPLLIGVPVVG